MDVILQSDFYQHQMKLGISKHVEHLTGLAKKSNVKFIDLNLPDLGFQTAEALFSDEDHLGTCIGSEVLTRAIYKGLKSDEILPKVALQEILKEIGDHSKTCGSPTKF